MFIGHFAVGFAARRATTAVSLGTLFLAAQLADLVWPDLLLLGLERVAIAPGITAVTPLDFQSYPYSHSLLALGIWGAALALLLRLMGRPARDAVVAWLVVLSHWLLDVATHRPDMPIVPWGELRVGAGLWGSLAATVAVEGAIFVAAVALYARGTEPRDRTGTFALWGLVAFLVLVYAANLAGPPPPSVTAIAWAGHAMWLLVAWGYWVDRHRRRREPFRSTAPAQPAA